MERKEMFIHHPQLGHQNLARGGFLNWKDIARQNKSNTNKCQTHSLQYIFFSLINIVTCGSWGRFAVRLPGGGGGGVQPWESTSTTPACMAQHNHVFHAWGASPRPQHREQRSSHGNFQQLPGSQEKSFAGKGSSWAEEIFPKTKCFSYFPTTPLSWCETVCKTRSIPHGKFWKHSKNETAAFFKSHWSGVWWKVRSSP